MVKGMSDFQIHGVSGMDPAVLLKGRPFGGCAIIYNKFLKITVTPVDIQCNRCCAVLIIFPNGNKCLLFNVYMPCDTENDVDNLDAFCNILDLIETTCERYDDVNSIIIGGDFNTDLSRINSLHTCTGALTNFVNQNGYVFGLNSNVGVEFTYENIATGSRSVIDHIIVSESLSSQVLSYYSIDSVDNMSDHRVLAAELKFDVERRILCLKLLENMSGKPHGARHQVLIY